MKTPDEIKKGLERCKDDRCICDECEFSDGNVKKWRSLMGDALAYIKQLENHISLNDLRDAIYEDAVAHGLWFERDDCPTTCVEMIQDEVSELDTAAMEWEDDICDNNEDFVEELADVMIMCLSVAGRLEIDIDSAVKRKMEINRRRPCKHGKDQE